jgi:hypothetical protein
MVRYRTAGGRASHQRERSFGADLREAEDFALKVEYDKRAEAARLFQPSSAAHAERSGRVLGRY